MLQELDGKSVGNRNLKVADVILRSFDKKNKVALSTAQGMQKDEKTMSDNGRSEIHESSNGLEDGEPTDDGLAVPSSDSRGRSARDVVTPLAHMSYADQLEHKKKSLMQTLKRLVRQTSLAFSFHLFNYYYH